MTGRVMLAATGVAIAAWGVWNLMMTASVTQLLSGGIWLGGGVVTHDAVLAPATILGAWILSRLSPAWLRGPATFGAIVLGTITIAAVPVLGGWGRRADNPTLLPRDYWAGWLILAGVIAVGVLAAALLMRMKTRK